MPRKLTIFGVVTVLAASLTYVLPAFSETRIALVIGNGAYQNVPRLPNPPNDAKAVAAALRRAGFDTIIATDLDEHGMEDAAIRFSRAARTADVALFYYSGHALQFNGVNYLAPVDATLSDESDLRRMTRVDEIVSDLQQAKSLRILVLDSCRDNPFAEQLRRSIGTTRAVPIARGLAKIDAPQGMIMAYATQAGHTAEDGDGTNSPYTAAFLKHIEEQNEIGTIFREVSEDVYETTKHTQLPELSLSIIGRFYLRGKVQAPADTEGSTKPMFPGIVNTTSADFEAAAAVDTVAGWDAFLKQHPEGLYADLARERKTNIAKRQQAKEDARLASLSPPAEKLDQQSTIVDLPKALQTELRRVGCNIGSVDGNWNAASQKALELFNKHAGMRLDTKMATADALDVVKSKTGRVCPLDCDHGYKPEGETCVRIVCDPGSHLSEDNRCERDSRSNDRKGGTPSPSTPRSTAPTAQGGSAAPLRRADEAQRSGSYRACMGALPGCYERAIRKMPPDVARAWCDRKPTC
jgi:uncharacterized caspase-like protein